MHYKTPEEALDKWRRRLSRMDWNNTIVKFEESIQPVTYEQLTEFEALPYRYKVCFTVHPYPELPSSIYLKEQRKFGYVNFGWHISNKYYSFVKQANDMIGADISVVEKVLLYIADHLPK